MWKNLVKKVLIWSLNYIYNYIDKDKDGKVSKEELNDLVLELNALAKKIKTKLKK